MVVNQYTNEVDTIDVLYAINAKKEEPAATKSPRLTAKPLSVTGSTISISDLLDYVNKYFPDILPENVLRHYNHEARPKGVFGENVLFSERDNETDIRYQERDSYNPYSEYDKPISIEDIQTLRSIGRKSINNFTSEDIKKAQKWAYKFYQQLGEKSPFFRAWFGDWRAYDKTPIEIVDVPNLPFGTDLFKEFVKQQSGEIYNEDTKGNNDNGWKIRISREGRENTISHSGGKRLSARALTAVRELVAKSVLLDTEVHVHHNNNSKTAQTDRIAFDHRLYALGRTSNGDINLYRITVEEIFQDPKHPNDMRFHNLKYIEKVAENIGSLTADKQRAESASDVSTTNYSISNLFDFVKRNDSDFNLGETSIDVNLLNEDGTPKKFYHGTNEKFTEFNPDEFAPREGSVLLCRK